MRREIAGLRLLITGASSGIGRAVATEAAQRGARLALTARSAEELESLAASLTERGAEAFAVPGDLQKEADQSRIVREAADRLGGLDVLVNNAGVASWGHFADSSEEILRHIMEVNFFAPAELMRLCIPYLREGRQPAMVNVASMCGRRGLPAWSEYSASKFALCGLTEALRGEMARFDIDVLLIVPGLTRTNLRRNLLRNEGRMRIDLDSGMAPEEVASQILRALERNQAETVLGREARWILRINRFLPRFIDRMMARRVRQLYANA